MIHTVLFSLLLLTT